MRQSGIAQILASGFCFGFLGVFGKAAFALGLSPGTFLAWRFLGATLGLGAALAILSPATLRLPSATAVHAFLLGLCGYALFSSCYFYALRGLSVSLTVLLLYTYPIWVTVGARFLFGEHLARLQWAALPIVLGGLLLLLFGELHARDPISLALGLASSVFYSAYILASRRWLRHAPPLGAAFFVMLGAATVLGFLHVREVPSGAALWGVIAATAGISTVGAISLFLSGLQKLTSAEASMLSLAEPVTGVFLGGLVYRESLRPEQWLGALLIASGMVLVARAKRA